MTRFIRLLIALFVTVPALAQEWEPASLLGDFYPSFAIAVTHLGDDPGAKPDPFTLGDSNGILGVNVIANKPNSTIKVQITCDRNMQLFEPAMFEGVLAKTGKTYTITPVIPYNQTKLASLHQAVTTYITFTVTINGQKMAPRTEKILVHSINDCLFAYTETDEDGNEEEIVTDWMFAAYVNEAHPMIDKILQEALRKKYIEAFAGYQGDKADVYRQVMAVWRVLQDKGLEYSSITNVPLADEDVAVQHVRLFDESINNTQANCADGTVLLASILRKIDINPVLVVVPGHMFLGFDLDENGKETAYLETTMMGDDKASARPDALLKSMLTGVADPKSKSAATVFVAAVQSGNATYTKNKTGLSKSHDGYARLSVADARRAGIMPISYVVSGK